MSMPGPDATRVPCTLYFFFENDSIISQYRIVIIIVIDVA